ncbi:hypothetical protein K0M31_010297 [Melipona bicolor]|uniref:Uncharacterized protein n=1 Tax=Melipona bicolor TaxID=60889 RepID=A0AA40KIG1_9HYME|nr:hypothetical protein K0M31_010297 [Melipona bicolor]
MGNLLPSCFDKSSTRRPSEFLGTYLLVYDWLVPRVPSPKYSRRAPSPYRMPTMPIELWYVDRYSVEESRNEMNYIETLNVNKNYSIVQAVCVNELCSK